MKRNLKDFDFCKLELNGYGRLISQTVSEQGHYTNHILNGPDGQRIFAKDNQPVQKGTFKDGVLLEVQAGGPIV